MSAYTKEIIIQTLLELLSEKSMAKITVRDIVERCGINRNTFYYHFRDIPDVMCFTMKREIDKVMSTQLEVGSFWDGLNTIVDLLTENKKIALHIYRSVNRDQFVKDMGQITEYVISRYAGSINDSVGLTEEEKRLLMHFQKCAIVGVLLDWLEHGMEEDLAANARKLNHLFETWIGIWNGEFRRLTEE